MATKIVKDPIHGFIELNPLVVKIIDTPQFQRLRHLKQLGAIYYVYPGASHNRFEHCLGTYHLASRLLHELRKRLREVQKTSEENDEIQSIGITDRDVLRVEIAALCHDIGHGPFSHMFEDLFLNQVRGSEHKTHEDASREMLEYLVEETDILLKEEREDSTVNEYKGLTRSDLDFIKECIKPGTAQKEKGKEFLYEIVSNSSTGIDVDKWDYFAGDCHHLGMQNFFDHERFLKTARVVKHPDEDRWTIAYRHRDWDQVHEMYQTRRSLHRKACHHPVVKCIELMISEAFIKADKHIEFKGNNGRKKTLSTAIDDVVAYTQVTDEVAQKIAWIDVDTNTDQDLWKAQQLIQRIMRRDLYLYIGDYIFERQKEQGIDLKDSLKKILEEELKAEMLKEELKAKILEEELKAEMLKEELKAEGNDEYVDKYVAIHVFPLDVGIGNNDPTEELIFYKKDDLKKGMRKIGKSRLLPDVFREMNAHVYFKSSPRDKMDEHEKSICEKLKKALKNAKKRKVLSNDVVTHILSKDT